MLTFIAIAILLFFAGSLLRRWWLVPALAAHRSEEANAGRMPRWEPSSGFNVDVVGESFYRDALLSLLNSSQAENEIATRAVLVPYVHDKDVNAVRVEVGAKIVGHLSRDDARAFRDLLNKRFGPHKPTCCDALIGARRLENREYGPIGVRLSIKDFD